MRVQPLRPLRLSAIYMAVMVSLSACAMNGGGMQMQQPASNSPQSPQPSPSPQPYQPYQPAQVQPVYNAVDNQLVPTGALAAQQAGYTGKGVNVGVMDTGANPSVAGLQGRLTWFNSYIAQGNDTPNQNNLSSANDPYGHGTAMADIIGGAQQGTEGTGNYFVGGVAPQSNLYIAQVCNSYGECQIYPKAYQDLTADGVHLFNQSFGALSSELAASEIGPTAHSIGEIFSPLGAGNLYVWSAGDLFDGQPQSDINIEALVPEQIPSLQPQWLVVTSVHIDANGNPDGLSSYAPDCGAAAQWCLAAPGYAYVATDPGTSFFGATIGTSASAAVVTGVSALVWQAFPWFTPANVTDTVLTTATPLGSGPYPNATYGWGEVNAAKAVNGPAQLAFGTFNANIGTYQSTFANAISGNGGLALSGSSGTLTLAGANTYSGGTVVNSGNLRLSGSLASGVTINGGSFGGPGTVDGNATNNGGTLISQSPMGGAGLTITGNYTAGKNATTAIGIGNPLTVGGTASLAGTLELLAPPTDYSPKSTETLIDAGVLQGKFAQQTYGAGVYYTVNGLNYGQHRLTATVTRSTNVQQTTAALPSVNATDVAVAGAIQKSLTNISDWNEQQQIVNAGFLRNAALFLSAQNGTQAETSLSSLSGEIYGTLRVLEAQQTLNTMQTIGSHMNTIGHGGIWVQGNGAFGTFRQQGTATAHYSLSGVVAGVNVPLNKDVDVGAAVYHGTLQASLSGLAGQASDRADAVALYGRAGRRHGVYLSGQVNYGWSHLNVTRDALLGNTLQNISGRPTEHIIAGSVEMGDHIAHWTPYVGWTGMRLNQSPFTETGADGFGLTAAGQGHSATYFTAGLRYGTHFLWGYDNNTLTGWIAWQRLLSGANTSLTAALAGMPSATFTVYGQSIPRNTFSGGITFDTRFDRTWSGFIGLSLSHARGSIISQAGDIGVRANF